MITATEQDPLNPDDFANYCREHGYVPFDLPRRGLFNKHTDVYGPDGWVQEQVEVEIIGEDNDTFVEQIIQSDGHGEWINGELVHRTYVVPIGFNKSRLLKWISTQTKLF